MEDKTTVPTVQESQIRGGAGGKGGWVGVGGVGKVKNDAFVPVFMILH